jgi:hypothetical protein
MRISILSILTLPSGLVRSEPNISTHIIQDSLGMTYIPDSEASIAEDLSFLDIALVRFDRELCDQLISSAEFLLIVLLCSLAFVWAVFGPLIHDYWTIAEGEKESKSPRSEARNSAQQLFPKSPITGNRSPKR